jgi:homoserine kinase
VTALAAGRPELLRIATEDAIHQPPRSAVFPALPLLIHAALEAGAYGAFLSGAGSSVMALVAPEQAETVGEALAEAARTHDVPGRLVHAEITPHGATVTESEETYPRT